MTDPLELPVPPGQVILMREDGVLLQLGADGQSSCSGLSKLLEALGMSHPLVVSRGGLSRSHMDEALDESGVSYSWFHDFSSNPTAEEVAEGYEQFVSDGCDSLVSLGGGSAIDVAKCIKAMHSIGADPEDDDWLGQPLACSDLRHLAIPTTAGTGSESTHFAVVYKDHVKHSVAHESLLPDAVILDASLINGLPLYQKEATLLDALCQAVESHWSARSTPESRAYSAAAMRLICDNASRYLAGDDEASEPILLAANLAGRAINMTTTTAAHAMSYELTSQFGIAHGHAVALCLPGCWRVLIEAADDDPDLRERLDEIDALLVGDGRAGNGLDAFLEIRDAMHLRSGWEPENADSLELLADSVNAERLSNFPVDIDRGQIMSIYEDAIRGGAR